MTASGNRRKRPVIIICLSLVLLVLAAMNWLALFRAIGNHAVYTALAPSIPVWLLAVQAGIAGILWAGMAVVTWLKLTWSRVGVIIAIPAYSLLLLLQQALFAHGDYERGRIPFLFGVATAGSLLCWFILSRARVKQAFSTSPSQSREIDSR